MALVRPFVNVQIGGTFDRLHEGHKMLLTMAFKMGDTVSIAINSDDLVKDKAYAEVMQPLAQRIATLEDWVEEKFGRGRHKISVTSGVGGVYDKETILDPDFEASILNVKTVQHGININKIRREHGLLPVVIIGMETNDVSSTQLRRADYLEKFGNDPYADNEQTTPRVDAILEIQNE